MSFMPNRDSNNQITKKNVIINTIPTASNSYQTITIQNKISINSISLNNIPVTVSTNKINYLDTTPGVAEASKAIISDSNIDITNLNELSCNDIIIGENNLSNVSSVSSSDSSNVLVSDITSGLVYPERVVTTNYNTNIKNINSIGSKEIIINNKKIVNYNLKKKFHSNEILSNNYDKLIKNNINNNKIFSLNNHKSIEYILSLSSTWYNNGINNINHVNHANISAIAWSPELCMFVASSLTPNTLLTENIPDCRFVYSYNGYNWNYGTMTSDIHTSVRGLINNVIWANKLKLFIATSTANNINNKNRIITSSDGINWTPRFLSVSTGYSWNTLCWSPELSIVLCGGGQSSSNLFDQINYSYDGLTWNVCTLPIDEVINNICWSSKLNMFIASSVAKNIILYSYNGIDWQTKNIIYSIKFICWSNELEMFTGLINNGTVNNRFVYSFNGLDWYKTLVLNDPGSDYGNIIWAKTMGVFITIPNTSNQHIMISYNGMDWTVISANIGLPASRNSTFLCWSNELSRLIIGLDLGNTAGNKIYISNSFSNLITNFITNNQITYSLSNLNIGINNLNPQNKLDILNPSGSCLKLYSNTTNTFNTNFNISSNGILSIIPSSNNFNIVSDFSTYGLKLNNILITTNINNINNYIYNLNTSNAIASSPIGVDNNLNINNINVIGADNIYINNVLVNNSTNNTLLNNSIIGSATSSKAIIVDNNINITNINNLSIKKINLNNSDITFNPNNSNINLNYINNNYSSKYNINNISKQLSTWTPNASYNAYSFNSGCWSPKLGIYLLLGQTIGNLTTSVVTSNDGESWSTNTSTILQNSIFTSVCWSSKLEIFVAVGTASSLITNNNIVISYDGINWSSASAITTNDKCNFKSICWSDELEMFVAVGGTISTSLNGVSNGYTSYDGIHWTRITVYSSYVPIWNTVIWASGINKFIAISSVSLFVITSSNGIDWSLAYTTIEYINDVTYSPKLNLIMVLSQGYVYYSKDSINWNFYLVPQGSTSLNKILWIEELEIFFITGFSTTGDRVAYSKYGSPNSWIVLTGVTNLVAAKYYKPLWSRELKRLILYTDTSTTNPAILYSPIFNSDSATNTISNQSNEFNFDYNNKRLGLGVNNPAYLLELSTDSAKKPTANTWVITSDMRVKENIIDANLEECITKIKNLKLKRYKWKDEFYSDSEVRDRRKLGWIAQDVEQIFPNCITTTTKFNLDDFKLLNTDQIIASLYGCTQKLINDTEELENNELTLLEDELNNIDLEIKNLEII